MSRKYIAREVLKRLRLGEPLGEELIRKFIRFLPELYKDSNGYDDFAKLRHDVFSAFRHDHADRLIGFDLGACWGAISEEESVSLDYAQAITSLRVNNAKLREELEAVGTAAYLYGRNDLKAENAKLRELVARMYKSIRWSDMTSGSMFSVAHSYEKDMRELGIEAK